MHRNLLPTHDWLAPVRWEKRSRYVEASMPLGSRNPFQRINKRIDLFAASDEAFNCRPTTSTLFKISPLGECLEEFSPF